MLKFCICVVKTGSSTIDLPCSIVYAGLEPIDFINLFPKWTINMKARQHNQFVCFILKFPFQLFVLF